MPLSSKSSSVVAVQTTNDSSLLSKHSMCNAGYISDAFMPEFVNKTSKNRTALINRGYYVRAKAIQAALQHWLQFSTQNSQIISLGAGFDTLYFRLNQHDFNPQVKVFELDYQDVVLRKSELIKASQLLSSKIPENSTFNATKTVALRSEFYNLIGVDLKNIDEVEEELRTVDVDFRAPTLFLSECAITYMKETDSTQLIKWASSKFENAVFVTYEQICPDDGFGQVMVNHFQSTASPLLSVEVYKTASSHRQRYLKAGWWNCEVLDMNSFYHDFLSADERERIEKLELFEEWEEFYLKCAHYVLIVSSCGETVSTFPFHFKTQTPTPEPNKTFQLIDEPSISNVNRFGHRSVLMDDRFVVTLGGFGAASEANHRRLSNMWISDVKTGQNSLVSIPSDVLKAGIMFHSLTAVGKRTLLLYGGRTSPSRGVDDVYRITFDVSQQQDACKWRTNFEKISNNFQHEETQETPKSRWRHSATSVLINGKLSIVVFGGRDESGNVLGDCFYLDIDSLRWSKITADVSNVPAPRHSHSGCSWQNKVVICGGLNDRYLPTNNVYVLNCQTLKWNEVVSVGLLPRFSHTSHVWNDKLFVVGGVGKRVAAPGIGILDLNTNLSFELDLPLLPKAVLLNKHSAVLLAEEEPCFLILGGGGNCFSFGTHFNSSTIKVPLQQLENLIK